MRKRSGMRHDGRKGESGGGGSGAKLLCNIPYAVRYFFSFFFCLQFNCFSALVKCWHRAITGEYPGAISSARLGPALSLSLSRLAGKSYGKLFLPFPATARKRFHSKLNHGSSIITMKPYFSNKFQEFYSVLLESTVRLSGRF